MAHVNCKLFSALCIACITSLMAFAQVSAAETNADQKKTEVRVYEVFGMGCPACQGGLAKLVKKVEGVREAEVNWKEQRVKVTFHEDSAVDDEKIFEAIRKANFTPGKRLDGSESDGKG